MGVRGVAFSRLSLYKGVQRQTSEQRFFGALQFLRRAAFPLRALPAWADLCLGRARGGVLRDAADLG
jgi:hypothetical protein